MNEIKVSKTVTMVNRVPNISLLLFLSLYRKVEPHLYTLTIHPTHSLMLLMQL